MTSLRKRKQRQQRGLQQMIEASERLGLYAAEDAALATKTDKHEAAVQTGAGSRSRRTAQRALQEFVLTGSIRVDAQLLADLGFRPARVQELLAANTVRELMNHYWFSKPLTMANAQEMLREWRERRSESAHVTPADGNVFADIGFPADEAQMLLREADNPG